MLLDFQQHNADAIRFELLNNSAIQLPGNDGDGRMCTLDALNDEYFVLTIENPNNDLTLMPLKNALYSIYDKLVNYSVEINLGVSIKSLFLGISFSKNDICENENKFLKCIKKLQKLKPVIFAIKFCELNPAINFIIDNSLKMKKKNANRVIYLTRSESELPAVKHIAMEKFKVASTMSSRQILKTLGLYQDLCDVMTDDEVDFTVEISCNSIDNICKLINAMNGHKLSYNSQIDKDNIIVNLLNDCFSDIIEKNTTEEILAFCSYSENFELSKHDIDFLIANNSNDIKSCIEKAVSKKLIRLSKNKIIILISLLKKIYRSQFEMRKGDIYNKLCEMIAEMYPSNYRQKTFYADYANDKSAHTYFAQYCMQCIRENGNIPIDEINKRTNFPYIDLISSYQTLNSNIFNRKYDDVVRYCDELTELPYVLDVEFKLLKCQALMKSLDNYHRALALNIVNAIDIESLDGNLKHRIQKFNVVSNIHLGNYQNAYLIYNGEMSDLHQKIDKHPSEELKNLYYSLLRKSNMVYNYQVAMNSMEKASDYFKSKSPTSYYLALVNCLGIHLKNYKLEEAKKDIDNVNKLQDIYYTKQFPREYIFENNKLIYDYIIGADNFQIETEFRQIYKSLSTKYADKFLIANNLAIFQALNGQEKEALMFLQNCKDEYLSNNEDCEGIYNYKYLVNSSIMEYILDNNKRDTLKSKLNKITFDKSYPNGSIMLREVQYVVKNMSYPCSTAKEWLMNYNSLLPQNRPRNGYELGFVLTILFSWDDD